MYLHSTVQNKPLTSSLTLRDFCRYSQQNNCSDCVLLFFSSMRIKRWGKPVILDGNWQTQISVAASQRPPLCLSATEELGPLLIHGIRGDRTQTRKDKVWEGKWMRMASEERQKVKLINNSSGGRAGGRLRQKWIVGQDLSFSRIAQLFQTPLC